MVASQDPQAVAAPEHRESLDGTEIHHHPQALRGVDDARRGPLIYGLPASSS